MKKTNEEIKQYEQRFMCGEVYFDARHKELVEYRFMGKTGYAIVCEPGDAGGGLQSMWGADPDNLEEIVDK